MLAGGEFRCHYGAHSVDTTSPYLSASELAALKTASYSQSSFDAAWTNTAAASWYTSLPTQDSWKAYLRDVVIRRL